MTRTPVGSAKRRERLGGRPGQRLDEARLVVPRVDEDDRRARRRPARPAPRRPRAGSRRRSTSAAGRGRSPTNRSTPSAAIRLDDRRRSAARCGASRRRPRTGRPRAGELRLERRPAALDDPRERRAAADRPVAPQQLLEQVRRRRVAAPDVGVVGLDLVEPVGAPVGHEQDGVGGHAGLLRRGRGRGRGPRGGARASGSVPGRTPCPRLKTWPGRPPACVEDPARRVRRRPRTGRAGAPGRGCPGRRGRRRAPSPRPGRSASRGR